MNVYELTCDVQRVCKKKCEALLHATSCMHARTRVRCNELHDFSESVKSDPPRGGVPAGGSVFALSAKVKTPPRAEFRPPPPPPPFSHSTTPFSHFPPPKPHFRTTFARFRQLFNNFSQLFNKFYQNFYVLTLLF